jgi:hypothetical protein
VAVRRGAQLRELAPAVGLGGHRLHEVRARALGGRLVARAGEARREVGIGREVLGGHPERFEEGLDGAGRVAGRVERPEQQRVHLRVGGIRLAGRAPRDRLRSLRPRCR